MLRAVLRDADGNFVVIELKAGPCPAGALEQVLGYSSDNGGPTISFAYNRELQHQVQNLRAELLEKGYRLFRAEPETQIDYSASFKAAAESSSAAMDEILVEVLSKEGLDATAIDLWNNPGNADAILEQLLERFRLEEYAVIPGPTLNPQ